MRRSVLFLTLFLFCLGAVQAQVRVVTTSTDPDGTACTLTAPPTILLYQSGSTFTTYICTSSTWSAVSAGTGTIGGTASTTDNAIVRTTGTGGVTVQGYTSNDPTISDAGAANFPGGITGALTGNADTATALAANGSNCSAGSAPLGVDASGAAETCTDYEEDLANSAGLAAALSDETGTGAAVFATGGTISPKIANRVYYANEYATGGTGSAADPYTGWDQLLFISGANSNASPQFSTIKFPARSGNLDAYYELSKPIAVAGRASIEGAGAWRTYIVAASGFTPGGTMIDLSNGSPHYDTRVSGFTLDGNDIAAVNVSNGITGGANGADENSGLFSLRMIGATDKCYDSGDMADMYTIREVMCQPSQASPSASFIGFRITNNGAGLHGLDGISCYNDGATKLAGSTCIQINGTTVALQNVHIEHFETGVSLGDDSATAVDTLGVRVSAIQGETVTDLVKINAVTSTDNTFTIDNLRCYNCTGNMINDVENGHTVAAGGAGVGTEFAGPYTQGGFTSVGDIDLKADIIFEGATADAYETTLTTTDPTADRTITLPDATGTVALTSDIPTGNLASQNTLDALDEYGDLCAAGESVRRNGTDSANECFTAGAASGDVTDVFNCATGDCNQLTIGESEYLIGGAVDGTTDPYISLPQGTDCSSVTGEGRICWDTDGDTLYVGDGTTAQSITGGGGGAPTDATYITQTANGTLSAEQALGALATGILKNTTTTGVLSIATQGTDYYAPGGTDVADADVVDALTIAGGTIGTSAITLVQSATPAPTAEGVIEWDTDDNRITVGDGATTQTFYAGAHTTDTDTTCNDAGVTCLFAASASEGGAATTATALAADPTDCSANEFANAIAASGNLTCAAIADADVPDTITASNYLPLAGGTMTGSLVTDNLGIEFEDSDTNPTCGAGEYKIYADLSETTFKKCMNGSATDLDTTGGTPAFSTLTGGTNTAAAMVVGTGASLAVSGSGTIAATDADTVNAGAGTDADATVVTVDRASTDATLAWDDTADEWDLSNDLNVAGTITTTASDGSRMLTFTGNGTEPSAPAAGSVIVYAAGATPPAGHTAGELYKKDNGDGTSERLILTPENLTGDFTVGATGTATLDADVVDSAEIAAGAVGVSELAASITFADGDLLDFGSNVSSATEGIMLPANATDCSSATAEGQVCWEEDAQALWVGNGSAAVQMNAAAPTTEVRSMYWGAGAMSADGTNCADPAEVTINSGPKIYTVICTDNDASTLYGSTVMPDGWNAGTVTFELSYIQTAADTSALNSDITAQCHAAGETINSTWGTEVAIDDAALTGSNAVDMTTSGAVTPAGTCAAGDILFWRWQMDATGTTTAAATLNIVGLKMEYTSDIGD